MDCRAGGGPDTFGSEPRRVTDVLIVTNIIAFALQLATGNRLIMAGAKARSFEYLHGSEYTFLCQLWCKSYDKRNVLGR